MNASEIKPGDAVEWHQMWIGGELVPEPTFVGTVLHVISHKAGDRFAHLCFKADGMHVAVQRDPPFVETMLISGRQIKSYGDRAEGWQPSDTAFQAKADSRFSIQV